MRHFDLYTITSEEILLDLKGQEILEEEQMCLVTIREDGGFVQLCNCKYGSTHCEQKYKND